MRLPLTLSLVCLSVLCASVGQTPPAHDKDPSPTTADPSQPTRDGRVGRGCGVFVKITARGSSLRGDVLDKVMANPNVAGVQATVIWSELEPRKGLYRWDGIDALLERCRAAGKQVALTFTAVSGRVPTAGQMRKGKAAAVPPKNRATPAWLLNDPSVRTVGGIDSPLGPVPRYPLFWDPAYRQHLDDFIVAFARRYDGHPRIEFIRMGGWQVHTNEPNFYGGATGLLRRQLADHGESSAGRNGRNLSADGPYARTVVDLIDMWRQHFRKTRLAATIHMSRRAGSFEEAMNRHCAEARCTLLNTGLNEAGHRGTRRFFRRMHDRYACKVGWGGLTHLGMKLSRDQIAGLRFGLHGEAFRQGIGIDGDARYEPASRASYLIVGPAALESTDAIAWAAAHLVQ